MSTSESARAVVSRFIYSAGWPRTIFNHVPTLRHASSAESMMASGYRTLTARSGSEPLIRQASEHLAQDGFSFISVPGATISYMQYTAMSLGMNSWPWSEWHCSNRSAVRLRRPSLRILSERRWLLDANVVVKNGLRFSVAESTPGKRLFIYRAEVIPDQGVAHEPPAVAPRENRGGVDLPFQTLSEGE